MHFLSWTKNGISINIFIQSDDCEYGLGGYNIYSGNAWILQIITGCIGHVHINILEFLASVVSIWLAMSTKSIKTLTADYHK